jgi:uncharacterized protein YicC (UPF0701 family)
MLSLTGFGTGLAADARGEVRIALSAVNSRSWQLALKSELGDLALDDELKSTVRQALVRGSVTAQIQVFATTTGGVDRSALIAAWQDLATLARELGAPPPALEQVAKSLPTRGGTVAWGDLARHALQEAIVGVQRTRTIEGAALGTALRAVAAHLRQLQTQMAQRAAERLPLYREGLLRRLHEVLAEQVPPEIVAREVALQAERIDITEEQVRLAAHLDALDALLAESGEIGRKLEFLVQELGREINTTGAKANDAHLTGLVLEAKLALDQLREQAANLA